jgi:hypothetical protein
MIYVDTSVIVKLYVKEDSSLEASNWLKKNNEAIPWTAFHELEFNNALHLKEFRDEITPHESHLIKERFTRHEELGVYYRPQLSWVDVFRVAVDLSTKHTVKTGSRSLDILHVAAALLLKTDRFLTFDERQSKLATLERIRIVSIT